MKAKPGSGSGPRIFGKNGYLRLQTDDHHHHLELKWKNRKKSLREDE
jgi:hypothetical protein